MCDGAGVIRLRAVDRGVVLSEGQVGKLRFWLMELVPARECEVVAGPGVEIVVHGEAGDVTPYLWRRVEQIVGCPLDWESA